MAAMRLKEMTALAVSPTRSAVPGATFGQCRRLDWQRGSGESSGRVWGTLDENDTGGVCGSVRTSVCASPGAVSKGARQRAMAYVGKA